MSRTLDLSATSPSVGFPAKTGTWNFLQSAYAEGINSAVRNMIGKRYDPTKGYVVYGCVSSAGGGGGWAMTEGAIFFNGELYFSPAQGGGSGVGTFLVNLVQTQYTVNADPVTFTDGIARDVHNIRNITYAYGTSGTGTVCDFNDLIRLEYGDKTAATFNGATVKLNQSQTIVYSASGTTTPNINLDPTDAEPGAVITLICPCSNGDIVSFTGVGVGYLLSGWGSYVAGVNGNWFITIKVTSALPSVSLDIKSIT